MNDEYTEEPLNPDHYYIKSWTEIIDGKKGKATWKCWKDPETGKPYEKLIKFEEER